MNIKGFLVAKATTGIRVFHADGTIDDLGIVSTQRFHVSMRDRFCRFIRRLSAGLLTRGGFAYYTIFTSAGEAAMVDALDAAVATWIDMGTGTGEAAKGDTTVTTWGGSRGSATQTQPAADQWRHVATLASGGTPTITECGLFDNATTGSLWIRSNFAGLPLTAADSIEFTITLEAA